jgi:hypothetical protein
VDGELRIGLFASVDIKAGTELTYDYNYVSVSDKEQPCYCGSARCRGVIGRRTQVHTESADGVDRNGKAKRGHAHRKEASVGYG